MLRAKRKSDGTWTRHVAAIGAWLAIAVVAADVADARPTVRFVDVTAGPVTGGPQGKGVPIAIFGTGFGSTRGRSTVTIGGRPVARYISWGRAATNPALQRILVQPGRGARRGAVVVTVAGQASGPGHTFTPTAGRIVWVAPNGSDTAPCSSARPCRTIQHVIDQAVRPGDAVLVRGPTVADDEVWVRAGAGGRPGRPVVIRNAPGARPLFTKTTRPVILEGAHVTFSGFRFGPGKGLAAGAERGGRDVRVVDNRFGGTLGFDAIGTHGDDLLVAGNVCAATGSTVGTQGHCFYISAGNRIRLLWNVGHGVPGYGIHIFDQQRRPQDIKRTITNVLVEGNTLSGSSERSGMIVAMGDEANLGNVISRVTIRGNTFRGNNHTGLVIGQRVRQVVVQGNRFVRNGRQGVAIADEPTIDGVVVQGNVFDQTANPSCRLFCEWYAVAHAQVGARAKRVRFHNNSYRPLPPRVIGAPAR